MKEATIIICILISFNACKNNNAELSNCLTVEKGFCGKMCFDAKKGNNLSEAIEAIKFEGIRSSYSALNYKIQELQGVKNESGKLIQ